MSALERYEQAMADLIAERTTGDDEARWPIVAFVTYVLTTDPETMTLDEPEVITPQGQRPVMSRGLLEEALDLLKSEQAAAIAYATWDEDDDDDD